MNDVKKAIPAAEQKYPGHNSQPMYRNGDPQRACFEIGYGAGYCQEGGKGKKDRVGEHRIGKRINAHGIHGMPGDKGSDTDKGIEEHRFSGDFSLFMGEQEAPETDLFKKRRDKEEGNGQRYRNPDICFKNSYGKKAGTKPNGQGNSYIYKKNNSAEQDIRSFGYGDETALAIYVAV